jgi:hypothetical protein
MSQKTSFSITPWAHSAYKIRISELNYRIRRLDDDTSTLLEENRRLKTNIRYYEQRLRPLVAAALQEEELVYD